MPQVTPKPVTPPLAVAAPAAPPPPRPVCTATLEPNGELLVQFRITADGAAKFIRQSCGKDIADFLWDTRGLRHFEHQRLV